MRKSRGRLILGCYLLLLHDLVRDQVLSDIPRLLGIRKNDVRRISSLTVFCKLCWDSFIL